MIHEVGWQDNPYIDNLLSAPAQRTLAPTLMNFNCNLNRFSIFLKGIDERSSNIVRCIDDQCDFPYNYTKEESQWVAHLTKI